jgi:ClpP class serine protease
MGGRAYGTLADGLARGRRQVAARVYAELAAKFLPLVDALGEISDAARRYTQADILRLYEIWLKTGSPRARGLLRQLGIEAAPVALLQN